MSQHIAEEYHPSASPEEANLNYAEQSAGHVSDQGLTSDNHETHATEEHVEHEISLAAEPLINYNGFNITNSLVNTWLVVFILVVFSVILRGKLKLIPKGLQNMVEIIVEGALNLADSVTGARKKTMKMFPIVFSIFVFVLVNNWMGLLPGIGSIGYIEQAHGHSVFIPFFRGGTADMNTTLALALISVVASNLFGIFAVGTWKYINKFVNIKALMAVPANIFKDPTVVIVNPIKFFVGIIEIVGEVAKVASLSFRLFGNVFAGEVLLASMAAILAVGLPIPFMFLELIVGVIQALIFAMLTTVYFSIAMSEDH